LQVLPNKDLFLVDYKRKLMERGLRERAEIVIEKLALDLLMNTLRSSQVVAMYSMVDDLDKSESMTRSWHEQNQSSSLCSMKVSWARNDCRPYIRRALNCVVPQNRFSRRKTGCLIDKDAKLQD